MKLLLHKIKNWEYWSVNIIYLPTFFLWIWYGIKFKSVRFFKFSNPSIKNGGLYNDEKMEIYQNIPENLYPKTLFISDISSLDLEEKLQSKNLIFPLIVKPNVGCRGIGVKKVFSINEIENYAKEINVPFLVQEVISFSNEIGLFYTRLPNQTNGSITGITIKNFLTVVGNGHDTILELLLQNPRHAIQIPNLKNEIDLNTVLPFNEVKCLVPFGNHSRGTQFLDGKHLITPKLEKTFDRILSSFSGFYYGRLDIRFNTFEELEEGENFSIIEINGAKSEPTHIYDPKHSFWFGQNEIFKHQRIFAKIIDYNLKYAN